MVGFGYRKSLSFQHPGAGSFYLVEFMITIPENKKDKKLRLNYSIPAQSAEVRKQKKYRRILNMNINELVRHTYFQIWNSD